MEQLNQILYEHRRNQEFILYMRQWIKSNQNGRYWYKTYVELQQNQNKIEKELIKTVKNIQMSLANQNINTSIELKNGAIPPPKNRMENKIWWEMHVRNRFQKVV